MISGSFQLAFIGPGGPEIVVVMLVLLLLFGSKDAPRMFRRMSEILAQIRATAENFKREMMYSDIHEDRSPDEDAGEYDDYGLTIHKEPDSEGAMPRDADEDAPVDRQDASDATVETQGEDGDVPKA